MIIFSLKNAEEYYYVNNCCPCPLSKYYSFSSIVQQEGMNNVRNIYIYVTQK